MAHLVRRAKFYLRKYGPELAFSLVSAVVGLLLASSIGVLVAAVTTVEALLLGLLGAILILLVLLTLSIKRNLTWKVRALENLVSDLYGHSDKAAQYVERRSHFRREKDLLARDLVKRRLPSLITDQRQRDAGIERVALIVDSGTTLAPLFPLLKFYGAGVERNGDGGATLDIYTNSLSGIEAFNRETGFEPYPVAETQLHLLGGNPLDKYRATTGMETLAELDRLAESHRDGRSLIVGILTANWVVIGLDFANLQICASGRGHFRFKERLSEVADLLVVVAPLGKILKLTSVKSLNQLLRDEQVIGQNDVGYKSFSLPRELKDRCYLLTSRRRRRDSLLYRHSLELLRAAQRSVPTSPNYRLLDDLPIFDPGGPPESQLEEEMPHYYLRKHQDRVFA